MYFDWIKMQCKLSFFYLIMLCRVVRLWPSIVYPPSPKKKKKKSITFKIINQLKYALGFWSYNELAALLITFAANPIRFGSVVTKNIGSVIRNLDKIIVMSAFHVSKLSQVLRQVWDQIKDCFKTL